VAHVAAADRNVERYFLYGPAPGPGSDTQPIRILFMSNFDTYNILMDRHPYSFYQAAQRHPWVVTDLWGHGFPGWNPHLSLTDNIKAKYGRVDAWDIINVWPVVDYRGEKELQEVSVFAYREHECWHRMCKSWGDRVGAGIYMFTYP